MYENSKIFTDRQITMALKGSAIILMFIHHLFGCGTFLTVSPYGGVLVPFFEFLGHAGKICIGLYLFVSGYGLFKSYVSKAYKKYELLKRIFKFLISYYIIMFLVAIPYLIYAGKFEVKYLFINLFALIHNDEMLYVSFSWYVKLYLSILVILPIIREMINKVKSIYIDVILNIVVPIAFKILFSLLYSIAKNSDVVGFIIDWCVLISRYYPLFGLGLLCAKYNIFELIKVKIPSIPKCISVILLLFIMSSVLYIRIKYNNYVLEILYVFIYSIAFGVFIDSINTTNIVLRLHVFLGKYSFQYWLLSGMFFLNTVELQHIIFFPYYTSCIVIWSFVLLLLPAILFSRLSDKISKVLFMKFLK